MQLKNTAATYGSIAKFLHWTTAILFLLSYCSIYYREWVAQSDLENWIAIQLHFSAGITILVVTALRLIWRFSNQKPEFEPGTRLQHLLAKMVHYMLYAVMLIMPISGYLLIADYLSSGRGSITYLLWFDMTMFKDVRMFELIGITLKQLEDPAEFIHRILGEWLVWLLILGHAFAALYHHIIRKDRTLKKMIFHKS
jgi:cytochrome b561